MGWLRSKSKRGSWVALFAIALQLALSFGHIHLDHLRAGSGHNSIDGVNTPATAFTVLTSADELPLGADDECAVCALVALANFLILPLPASLPVPKHFAVAQHAPALVSHVAQTTLRPFQARAPPLV